MTHGDSDRSHHSISPLRSVGGRDGLNLELSVPSLRAHPRSSKFLSPASAPLARSVSHESRSSERSSHRSLSDQIGSNVNTVQTCVETIPQLSPLADSSRGQATEPLPPSSASSNGHPRLPRTSSAEQHYTLNANTTASPRLNTTVEDVSQAITSRVANCFKTGTLDEFQMQMIVQTSLLSLMGPQASSPKSVNSRFSNHSAPHGRQIFCDECPKTLTRHCDMKYAFLTSSISCSKLLTALQEAQKATFEALWLHFS